LNFHAPYGTHYGIRIPKFGRDLEYHWDNCDLFVSSSGNEIYRLNLEQGQFKEPFHLSFDGCNKMHMNPVHKLLACGGESTVCEFWDIRVRQPVSTLCIDEKNNNLHITALQFDNDGLSLAVGTSTGNCLLYDIRSKYPLYTKEHQYGLPIVDITFHNSSRHIISTDKKLVKIWERDSPTQGKILTNIETPVDINAIHCVEDRRGETGLIFAAGEQPQLMSYFIPQLGPAPRWCSFLEGLTEELEESTTTNVYEDYKFITKQEVEEIGASSLIGTALLRGYMHGYFIEMKLYNKLRAISKPFEYEEYRLKRIREKIEEKRKSRITAQKRLPKVNKELAEKLTKLSKKSNGDAVNGIDSRFADLFTREEFQQDENAEEFKLRNPNRGKNMKDNYDSDDDLNELYDVVNKDDKGHDDDEDDEEDDDDIDEEDFLHDFDLEDDHLDRIKGKKSKRQNDHDDEEGPILKSSRRIAKIRHDFNNHKRVSKQMYELNEGIDTKAVLFRHTDAMKAQRQVDRMISSIPLEERLKRTDDRSKSTTKTIKNKGFVREISFVPKSDSKKSHPSKSSTRIKQGDNERINFMGGNVNIPTKKTNKRR
jgi:ribosome biogenesis protein ENP2